MAKILVVDDEQDILELIRHSLNKEGFEVHIAMNGQQAIDKANRFGFDLEGSVMASDAFFPFPDCVEIAHKAGITAVIQPGGSIKDELSINYCNENKVAMVFTGTRHFKH